MKPSQLPINNSYLVINVIACKYIILQHNNKEQIDQAFIVILGEITAAGWMKGTSAGTVFPSILGGDMMSFVNWGNTKNMLCFFSDLSVDPSVWKTQVNLMRSTPGGLSERVNHN